MKNDIILPQPTENLTQSDKVEMQVKKQQQKEQQKLAQVTDLRKLKNLILWEIDTKNDFTVKRAEIKQSENKTVHLMSVNGKGNVETNKPKDYFVYNKECLYIWKMNLKSAQKVADRLKKSIK